MRERGSNGVKNQSTEEPGTRAAVAWAYAEIGAEWDAHWLAFEGIDQPEPPDALRRLWRSAYLRYARVTTQVQFADWAEPIQARLVAQALAGRPFPEGWDAVLRLAATGQGLSAARLARLCADIRLESPDAAAWRDADARYAAIESDGGLGLLDAADICFNRGVIAERLADTAGAIVRYRAARAQNPLLEAAEMRLAALGAL